MITIDMNRVNTESDIGLGNHMFQYAICRLIAEKNNFNYYIPYNQYLKSCFPDIEIGIQDGVSQFYFAEDSNSQKYNPEIFNCPDFTHFWGYYQTEKYYEGNEDRIKSYFKIDLTTECEQLLKKYNTDDYCYMHIRASGNKLGDAKWLLPIEYYEKSMSEIRKIKNDMKFVIVTDDPEYSKEIFPNIDVLYNSVSTDFRLMYFSKYAIISNSTFSWWACWLSEKSITISPNFWLNFKFPEQGFYPVDIKSKKFQYIS